MQLWILPEMILLGRRTRSAGALARGAIAARARDALEEVLEASMPLGGVGPHDVERLGAQLFEQLHVHA